jgi:uroporphyrinogen III methyltransferase/synthase
MDSRSLGNCKVCAVGPKTAASLNAYGIKADLVPQNYKAEGVIDAYRGMEMHGVRVLYPKADRAREVIPTGLAGMGATVVDPVAYCNVIPGDVDPAVLQALEERRIHCVTFTSSSTADNLARLLGENRFLRLLQGVAVAAIGPVTAHTCRELGLKVDIEPEEYTLAKMTGEIVKYFKGTD